MANREITSVKSAIDIFTVKPPPGKLVVYRGHSNYGWQLKPKILRSKSEVGESEAEIGRELVSVYPNEFRDDHSMFDRLVRMQHYGLPTRLMDVTRNPLIALYFSASDESEKYNDGAVVVMTLDSSQRKFFDSDTVSCLANLANLTQVERTSIETTTARKMSDFNELLAVDRLLQFIRIEKPSFRDRIRRIDLFRRLYVVPKMSNTRIVAQAGAFIAFGLDRLLIPGMKIPIKIERLRVPAASKEAIVEELNLLGIGANTLFPAIDQAAAHIVRTYAR